MGNTTQLYLASCEDVAKIIYRTGSGGRVVTSTNLEFADGQQLPRAQYKTKENITALIENARIEKYGIVKNDKIVQTGCKYDENRIGLPGADFNGVAAYIGMPVPVSAFDATGRSELFDSGIFLGAATRFFGHWFWEILPKILVVKGRFPKYPLLLPASVPKQWLDWISLIDAERKVQFYEDDSKLLIRQCVIVEPAIARKLGSSELRFTPEILLEFRRLLRRTAEQSVRVDRSARDRPVYFFRSSWRGVHNKQEVITLLKNYGFESVSPKILSVREQIGSVVNASLIALEAGSDGPITLLAPSGVPIIEMAHIDHGALLCSRFFCQISGKPYMRVNGQPIGPVTGPSPVDQDFTIGLSRLRGSIEFALSEAQKFRFFVTGVLE